MMKRKSILIYMVLIGILIGGTLIRIPGIYWGNVGITEERFAKLHPDEKTHIDIAKSVLDPSKRNHKPYITGFGQQIAVIASISEKLSGQNVGTEDLHYFGRCLSILYSIASVFLLFFIVAKLSKNKELALLSSFFLALCSLAITNSHFAVADAAASFWIMAVCFFCYKWLESHGKHFFVAAFVSGAVAVAVKISICVVGPLFAIIYFSQRKIVSFISALFIFVFTLLLATGFSLGVKELQGIYTDIVSGNMAAIPQHTFLETLVSVSISIFPSFSLPLVLLAGLGLSLITQNIWSNRNAWICFGLPTTINLTILLSSDLPFERHLLPFAPLFCGLAGLAWYRVLPSGKLVMKIVWSIPLIAYLLFFAIDGEMPFWRDNRVLARKWVEYYVEPGSSIYLGSYVNFSLPSKKYKVEKHLNQKHLVTDFDIIVLHEAHTYRYGISRLSPFRKPERDNVYHSMSFYRNYLDSLTTGELPFSLIYHIPILGSWAPERAIFKKFWGTFPSFVGDVWIYQHT